MASRKLKESFFQENGGVKANQVIKGLILGNVEGAIALLRNQELREALNLGGIVSLRVEPMPEFPYNIKKLELNFPDAVETDLLSYFNPSSDFIQRIMERNKTVFVHCEKGISRSATIVAAYLMRYRKFADVVSVLEFLENQRPMINPNAGFVSQLEIFRRLGFDCHKVQSPEEALRDGSIDIPEIPELYRIYMLKSYSSDVCRMRSGFSMQELLKAHDRNAMPYFLADPGNDEDDRFDEVGLDNHFSCSLCRRRLFGWDSILTHKAMMLRTQIRQSTFKELLENGKDPLISHELKEDGAEVFHQYLYIFPMDWMSPKVEFQWKGDILCPTCRTNLGYFSWEGERCPCDCGGSIQPSFKLRKALLSPPKEPVYLAQMQELRAKIARLEAQVREEETVAESQVESPGHSLDSDGAAAQADENSESTVEEDVVAPGEVQEMQNGNHVAAEEVED